ncbi:MAG: alpha/beta fold hydrolase [Spirochaetia bacterium]|nr:alpha/beta fold hydrolase [Spirochaetia bacterium]
MIMGIGIALAGLLVIYLAAAYGIGRHISLEFVYSDSKPLEHTLQRCLENGDFTQETFEGYRMKPFSVESDFGYTLTGVYRKGSDPTRTVVFVHGHTWTWHGQVKYFPLYLDRGYNIVAYNHRYHGDSGGENCTAGYYEKQDLKKIADWARRQFPQTEIFGVMGESLGAATSLQYMPLDTKLSFVHADCPYSDMLELYAYQMQLRHIPKLLRGTSAQFCRWYLKTHAQFDPKEVSPIQAIMHSSAPLLLIHGDADDYVPTAMSIAMNERRAPTADTTLVLIPGASHAQSLIKEPELYAQAVSSFLDRIEQR